MLLPCAVQIAITHGSSARSLPLFRNRKLLEHPLVRHKHWLLPVSQKLCQQLPQGQLQRQGPPPQPRLLICAACGAQGTSGCQGLALQRRSSLGAYGHGAAPHSCKWAKVSDTRLSTAWVQTSSQDINHVTQQLCGESGCRGSRCIIMLCQVMSGKALRDPDGA